MRIMVAHGRITALAFAARSSAAQGRALPQYPDRPIRLMLPFPAGGAVDIVARAWSRENGGGPRQAVRDREQGRRRRHDRHRRHRQGRARRLHAAAHHAEPHHQRGAAGRSCPTTPRRTSCRSRSSPRCRRCWSAIRARRSRLSEFVDYAKENPGKLNYSSAGIGTLPHVTMELLLRRTGIQVAHIPYRGAAPAMTDLLAGVVQLKLDTYATANPQVVAGKLRMLGIASRAALQADARRADRRRDGPARLRGHSLDRASWRRPERRSRSSTGSPPRAPRRPARPIRERLQRDGVDPVGGTPAEFAR